MFDLDISKYTPVQITNAFIIVIACVIAVAALIPKIKEACHNVYAVCTDIMEHISAGSKNKQAIERLDVKIDALSDSISKLIDDSQKSDENLSNEIGILKDNINDIRREMDKKEIDMIREKILSFATLLKTEPERLHSEKEFRRIIDYKTTYDSLIEKYNFENGVMETEYAFVYNTYMHCCETGHLLIIEENGD